MGHLQKREVPQEHSHDFVLTITREFLNLDNPKGIVDVVFGLLGNAAAAAGAGDVTNLDCLKQETADQAFTNAKGAKDLRGMAGALLFQAIERNTGGVGVASVLCTETAVNPEIAALTQHQDPASDNAGALNKAITLELAKQLAGIGADTNLALLSGTFAAGDPNDNTGKGNSCDDEEPNLGCIYSQGLLVLDASEAEVSAAVADVAQTFTGTGGIFATDLVDLASFSVASVTGSVDLATVVNGAAGAGGAAGATDAAKATSAAAAATSAAECVAVPPTTAAAGAAAGATNVVVASSTSAAAAAQTSAAASSNGTNIQAFTGTLGGPAPPVESSAGDRPFSVNGNTFVGSGAAIGRSCDIQHNACANAANSGQLAGGVGQCDQQATACRAANSL
ncbi:hypothetical protein BGZ61DRAFT_359123 [Ilyonectria robusta]|uniref:uncharacterized protein n=1 Tax=Ilyonectria robusta TaxID=1079257 RepID=UPI001E8DCB87|nr:uncharacterized protein BGZ61DRAFT_359123 [Ilyonectria robusta]KAH8680130.1 hypothetical protein BGZ61DRAFT_359123 [Ilyonectria robusta]